VFCVAQAVVSTMGGNKSSGTASTAAVRMKPENRFIFYLLIGYLFLDLVRPSFVWHFPKMISTVLLIAWIMKPNKTWCAQIWGFMWFLGILGFDIVIATNTYDAFWTTYGMFILLGCVCISLIFFTDTIRKIQHIVNALLLIFFYIAVYAITHAGFGPAGSDGGQDENYVAAAMNLAIPLAAFSFFVERIKWKKILFAGLVCAYILAIVIGLSRGGFVGLVAAFAFSILNSPKKGLAIAAALVFGGFLFMVAGSSYWDEMSTIQDTSEGTADLRLEFWAIATRQFLDYPLTGVGGGNFPWRVIDYQSLEQTEKWRKVRMVEVHSTFFQLLAEMGLAGCVVFGFILIRTYRDYRHVNRMTQIALSDSDSTRSEDLRWAQAYARGIMGGLVGYIVSVMFLSALYYSHIWIGVSLMAAIAIVADRLVSESQTITTARGMQS
jgi:O-antigen ligase